MFGVWVCSLAVVRSLSKDRQSGLQLASPIVRLCDLIKKLIEQHRVHRFVPHSFGVPIRFPDNQIWAHLLHAFGHEAKLSDAFSYE